MSIALVPMFLVTSVAETALSSVFGWLLAAFLIAIWLYLLIVVFSDVFSRNISGWVQAGWVLAVIILPLLGILLYLMTRPKPTDADIAAAQAAAEDGAAATTADRLEQLAILHDEGQITDEQFDIERTRLRG